jgi:hypothetical protein
LNRQHNKLILGRVDIYCSQSKDAVSATNEPKREANLS